MPVVFGAEVGDTEEVDWEWDEQLIDNNGKTVFDLGYQYIPPDQLFPSSRGGPYLLSCNNCAAVMSVEQLIQVKMEFYPQLNVNDTFNNMENTYRSEIVPICYTCINNAYNTYIPPVRPENTEVYVVTDNVRQASDKRTDFSVKGGEETMEKIQDTDSLKKNLAVEIVDSGENMDDSDIFMEKEKDEKMEDDSGVDCFVEYTAMFSCKICDSEFETVEEFGKHTRTHERINAAEKCPICSIHLSKERLYEHIAVHGETILRYLEEMKRGEKKETINKLKLNKCSICQWACLGRSKMKKHKRKQHYKCMFCGYYFKNKKQCKKHVRKEGCGRYKQEDSKTPQVSFQEKFSCATCQEVLFSQEELVRHAKMHITYKKCKICNIKVRSGEPFLSHARQHALASKENTADSSPVTSALRVLDENIGPASLDERDDSCSSAAIEHSLQEVYTSATITTWRQLSLQMQQMNKETSVDRSDCTNNEASNASDRNVSDRNIVAKVTNTANVDNIPVKRRASINNDSSISTNKLQINESNNAVDELQCQTEKVCHKSKKCSPEKENEKQLSETQKEFILEKKFSLKNNSKRIYFKRSPDILTMRANKQWDHTEINVPERVQSCTP
ncbi:RE1-silencing transcription factor A-like [Ylistrum balloti]|uniref:RE1-silencing transcription factor A-like n=1 Tax=Ylistrum balloti TaxID=509963 RepID=UPI002905AD6E|nr:RE1-silencing transcription factor A-like [Ylistrum balloti]